ncbi:uncharacterized protein BDW43DRAFT_282422 [Aspergillus alliaceus]|uniref:uncharacterized protein n=1 Tax=Petromyces alliaceus TaxID=209559 RepID=UPI0012A42987|nr:uncharacterized protein BDW43DRAFT_282422 [Aspergillus alliaceus]KAB8231486.1 hypothetical protein BDW43DRAFT_282422 [Aspergillus alliaceus]
MYGGSGVAVEVVYGVGGCVSFKRGRGIFMSRFRGMEGLCIGMAFLAMRKKSKNKGRKGGWLWLIYLVLGLSAILIVVNRIALFGSLYSLLERPLRLVYWDAAEGVIIRISALMTSLSEQRMGRHIM